MGSSIGVSKAKTVEAVRDAIAVALTYDEWVLVEEAVIGREIEVAVLGGRPPRASVPGEIVPGAEFYDYADKYVDDGSQALVPAPLSAAESDEVRALAVRVFEVLRADGLARVDFFYEEDGRGWLCNEINTMPGLHPDLDVPEAVAGDRVVLPGADRRAGPPGAGAPRPAAAAHRPLSADSSAPVWARRRVRVAVSSCVMRPAGQHSAARRHRRSP